MSINSIRNSVWNLLENDKYVIDFQWSLFISALLSYRKDTTLHPFPPMSLYNSSDKQFKDYKKVLDVCRSVPKIVDIREEGLIDWSFDALELFQWVMDQSSIQLKLCSLSKFEELKILAEQEVNTPCPDYIFEVQYDKHSESKFMSRVRSNNFIYGFHGSRLENFYSILHYGFYSHLNKNSLFGEGTYLAKELSVSLQYSPYGLSWELSKLGKHLSCVAFCEIIDDESVKHTLNNLSPSKSHIKDSIGGTIPQKYIIVCNNDMLRLKYLLVYSSSHNLNKDRSYFTKLLIENKFLFLLFIYLIILLCIGLNNSKFWYKFFKK